MTKLKPVHNTQTTPTQSCTEAEIQSEEAQSSESSASPSPPESPHSPTGASPADGSAFAELPDLPEIITLCQRLTPSIDDLNKKRLTPPQFMTILVRELTPLIHKHLAPKKTIKKKRDREPTVRRCSLCQTQTTPEWRRDPEGLLTLCNACGLKEKKRAKSTALASTTSNNSPRFHTTEWTQQYAGPIPPEGRESSHPLSRGTEFGSSRRSLPSSHPVPAGVLQTTSNGGPVYQTFQIKPQQTLKPEENRNSVYQNQRNHYGGPPNGPMYTQSYHPVYDYPQDFYSFDHSTLYPAQSEADLPPICPCQNCRPYYPQNYS